MKNAFSTLILIFAATCAAQTDSAISPKPPPSPGAIVTVPAGGNIQQAIDEAGHNGAVYLTPGKLYKVSSTLKIPYSYFIFNGNGACILTTAAGDGINITGQHVTLNDPCLMPGAASTGAAIHDQLPFEWSQVTINRPHLLQNGNNLPSSGYYWYYGLQVDQDELFTVNNWNGPYAKGEFRGLYSPGAYGVLRCDSTFCGSGIYNPALSLPISRIESKSGSGPWTFTTAAGNLTQLNLPGQIVQAIGPKGGIGEFNAFYTVTAVTGDRTFTATAGPTGAKPTGSGTATGGTISLTLNAAVGYINDSSLSMGCYGNPVDWEGGNDLHMKSVLFQAYNEYGLRVSINARGGSGNITVTGAHNEPGNCPNPAMNGIVGSAGYIINGGAHLKLSGGKGGGGQMPLFPSAGEPGSENYAYYMVIHKGKSNVTTQPLPIGYTAKGNATLSESNYVTVTAPTSTGIGDTCDFLRVDQTPGVGLRIAPHSSGGPNQIPGEGGGGKTPGVLCDPTVGTYLSFRDTSPGSNLQAYTFHTNSAYGPALDIFPGSYVLTGINYSQSTFDGACGFGSVFVVPAYSGLLTGPNITCEGPTLDDWTGNRTPYGMSFQDRIAGINPNSDLPSALMQPLWTAYAGTKSGPTKGVLNFGTQYAYAGGPTDAITIFDSDPFKTLAMPGNRPGADAADTAIGLDHGSKNGGLALRDNISISQYIGHVFDDASYLERLTSTAKMFNVPVVGLSFAGAGAATFAAGPAAGRSPGTPACAPSHVCDSVSGTINFTVGSSTKAGALLTVTTGIIRKHEPTCIGAVNLAAAPYTSLPLRITETTTTTEFNVGSAPTPFAVFELTYQCSGN